MTLTLAKEEPSGEKTIKFLLTAVYMGQERKELEQVSETLQLMIPYSGFSGLMQLVLFLLMRKT